MEEEGMKGFAKDVLVLVLMIFSSLLLVWGILMAYENWSLVLGVLIIVVALVLTSLMQYFVKGARA